MIPGPFLKFFKIFVLPKNLLDKLADHSNDVVALIMQRDMKIIMDCPITLTYCLLLGRRKNC